MEGFPFDPLAVLTLWTMSSMFYRTAVHLYPTSAEPKRKTIPDLDLQVFLAAYFGNGFSAPTNEQAVQQISKIGGVSVDEGHAQFRWIEWFVSVQRERLALVRWGVILLAFLLGVDIMTLSIGLVGVFAAHVYFAKALQAKLFWAAVSTFTIGLILWACDIQAPYLFLGFCAVVNLLVQVA